MSTQTEALKLVPIEPTNNMKAAASQLFAKNPKATPSDFYKVMVATAKEALAQPERPTCFADWQDTHATDRGCGNCHLRTECRTGQPEQKPVAEITELENNQLMITFLDAAQTLQCGDKLYTTPPQRDSSATPRTWEGLSIFEINDLVYETEYDDYYDLVKRTEALLEEKNNVSR